MRNIGALGGGSLLMCGTVLALGCQTSRERIVYENFARIRPYESTAADVERILGPPDHELEGLWMYTRADGRRVVKIEIGDDGSVHRKEWIDADQEVWEDSASP